MENEIIISFSKEELAELAKMIYVAQYVFECSEDVYPYNKAFNSARRKVNQWVVKEIPESGLAEVNGQSADVFTHTVKMEDDHQYILQAFSDECFNETVATALAERDFKKVYGNISGMDFYGVKAIYDHHEALMEKYRNEVAEHGLSRLYVEE